MRVTVRFMAIGFGICLLPQRAYKTMNNYIINTDVETAHLKKTRSVYTCLHY